MRLTDGTTVADHSPMSDPGVPGRTRRDDTVVLTTRDGAALDADVARPSASPARGTVVLCHPHPSFGGTRFHPIVDRLFTTLPASGWAALRFDFRPPAHHATIDDDDDDGVAATDLAAAIDHASDAGGELVVAGYSYGAIAALRSDDRRIGRIAAIAPPLAVTPVDRPPVAPTLLITAQHDQFTPTELASDLTATWPAVTRATIPSADHFLHGQIESVVHLIADWLADPVAR